MNKRNLYTKLAKYYDYLAPSTTKQECDFLDEVFKNFGNRQIKKVLDLGCGTGRHASLLQRAGYEITGIDLSAPMLEIAKKKSPQSTFLKMDFCSPDFDKNFFDASICMWSTIGYILDEEKFKNFVKNVACVTKELFILSSTNHEKKNFQPDEITERVALVPNGKITIRAMRHYNKKTGIREENYDYLVIENGREAKLTDKNKLRLWGINELRQLLLPEFKIVAIYGDYSTEAAFNKNKSGKKIIIAEKEN